MIQTHYRTCNLCEAMCGLEIQYEEKEVKRIQGDKKDPFSKGHICPKAVALKDIYEDPDRLKYPLRKKADGSWEQIGWEEAYDEVATRIQAIQEKYGKNAVGIYLGNPNVHNMGAMLFNRDFIKSLKTKNRFSATSVDQLPHHFAALLQFGHYMMIPIPDIDRTDFLLIFGANPLVSNGSLMTAAGVDRRLKAIQERGGKIVVIDPRRSETAKKADQHIFVKPGTDALVLLAMLHTIFEKGWEDLGSVAEFTDGLAAVQEAVQDFSPQKVATITGVSATEIVHLTQAFCQAQSAVCYGRIGVSTQVFGGLSQWLINVINIVTGNLDKIGGAMFTLPAFDLVAQTGSMGKVGAFARWKSRVRGLPEFGGELPVSVLAEEILTPGEGQIKAMVTVAGNPVLSTPNGQQLEQAFEQLEFMVSLDIYVNETSSHADLILPSTTGLETPHYDVIFHALAVQNTAKYSPALFEKEADQQHDWEILQALTTRLSGKPSNGFTPDMMLDFMLQGGPYRKEGMSLKKLKEEVHGVDLGPLKPALPKRLFTKNKHIQLAPEILLNDLKRLEDFWKNNNPLNKEFPFQLIGRRQLRSNNSWMHNSKRLVKGRDRCTLLIHPNDAASLNLENGQEVKVSSRVGNIQLKAEVSDEMMEGVVSIPHGWGHHRKNIKMQVAAAHAGASVNDLTDDQFIDELTGNAALCGVPVSIKGL